MSANEVTAMDTSSSQSSVVSSSTIDDAPEADVVECHDTMNILQSKLLFLDSKVNGDKRLDKSVQCKKNPNVGDESLNTASLYQLQKKLYQNINVFQRYVVHFIYKPLSLHRDPPLLYSTVMRLQERMEIAAKQNYELSELAVELKEVHTALFQAQTECDNVRQKFEEVLGYQYEEKKALQCSDIMRHALKTKEALTRQLLRTNFMRSLMVVMISNCDINLMKQRDIASVLFEYSMPLKLSDLKPS